VIDDKATATVATVDMTEHRRSLFWRSRAETKTVKAFRLKYSALWRHLETGLPMPDHNKLDAFEAAHEALQSLNNAKE
jgi:hypothetical protein